MVHAWFQAQRHPLLTPLMLAVTHLHGTPGLLALTALLAAVLWRRRARDWVLPLVVAVPGAMLLNVGLKQLVRRARPLVEQPVITLDSFSFPSGHAAGAAAFYAFLAAWLVAQARTRVQCAMAVCFALAMAAWVALSRVYLGVHYLTDVLAGALVGAAWALAWIALLRPRNAPI